MGLPESIAQRYYEHRFKKVVTELRFCENVLAHELDAFTRAGHKLPFEGRKSEQIGMLHKGSIDLRCELVQITGDDSWLTTAKL